ncbi:MAG: hypothetical protein ACYC27_03960 [Armatimonadota bacterium]
MKHSCFFILLITAFSIFTSAIPSQADVTIKGRIEYYDRLSGQTKPAKNVVVKARGNWWFAGDPTTQTDDNGYYSTTQRNPITGTFDIHINAFAQTGGKVNIYEWMLAWNTYSVDSPAVTGISGNQTCTINLVIGGDRNNVTGTSCRSIDENANAFLIHQEILAHYKKLESMGFPANVFKDTDVIAPAMGQGSYYNYISDFINLTETSLLGKEGWNWGTADWRNISNKNSSYIPYKYVLDMARHESSHRIHKHLASFILVGLNMPATHHANMETNDFLAFTEGFASFLPTATLNMPGVYEATPCKYENPLPILPSEPASGTHNACEGHVTALLVDLYDAANVKEQMRLITDKSVTGEAVPDVIMKEQKWTDKLSDINLTRIRSMVAKSTSWIWPVQTIGDFTTAYAANYPQDAHALKTIAYNRAIMVPVMPERPAYIDGQIEIGRADNKTIWIKMNMVEFDKEDRPFVTMDVWRQNGSNVTRVGQTINFGSNWRDIKHLSMRSLDLTPSQGPNDKLWLILSDEMQALAYTIPVPAGIADSNTDDSSNSSGSGHKDPSDRIFVKVPIPSIDKGDPADRISSKRDAGIRSTLTANQQQMTSAEQQAKVTEIQSAIRAARAEMLAYEEAMELAGRVDRALSGMANNLGGVQLSTRTASNASSLNIRGKNVGMTSITGDRAFQQWMGQVAAGQGLRQTLSADTKAAMASQLTLLNNAIQQRSAAAGRAQAAAQRLRTVYTSMSFAGESANIQKDIASNVDAGVNALTAISTDKSLSTVMQQQVSAVKAISAR